jgi:hypothetical protein
VHTLGRQSIGFDGPSQRGGTGLCGDRGRHVFGALGRTRHFFVFGAVWGVDRGRYGVGVRTHCVCEQHYLFRGPWAGPGAVENGRGRGDVGRGRVEWCAGRCVEQSTRGDHDERGWFCCVDGVQWTEVVASRQEFYEKGSPRNVTRAVQ